MGGKQRTVRVGRHDDLADGKRILVTVGDVEVCVLAHGPDLFAYENRCAHQGGPAAEGVVLGRVECVLGAGKEDLGNRFSENELHLVCPWHGWEYDLATGRCVTDSRLGLRKFRATRRGDDVYLDVPDD